MADTNTLCTSAQILLAIGKDASAEQILEANTNIWGAMAESDMESVFGDNIGLVANYGSITAANKQWLAGIAADRAAWRGINQNQNTWALSTTQSKLNVLNATWKGFLSDLRDRKADIVADLNL
tara:strand:- start:2335 stop:2706 length:372 start_codon:yes stop_codon:yes gene_type:complete